MEVVFSGPVCCTTVSNCFIKCAETLLVTGLCDDISLWLEVIVSSLECGTEGLKRFFKFEILPKCNSDLGVDICWELLFP